MASRNRARMNGILGMIELALDTPLTPEQARVSRFHGAVIRQRPARVLEDILDFFRIEDPANWFSRKTDLDPRATWSAGTS